MTTLLLGISSAVACGGTSTADEAAPDLKSVAQADTAPRGLFPQGAPPPSRPAAAGANGLDYDSTYVGSSNKVAVYYANSLGDQGRAEAQALLPLVAAPYADMERIFATTGGAATLVLAPLSGKNDGSGGAYHATCDFDTGGVFYVDATFASTMVDPVSWALGLYVAELSESFMGAQNKGWDCGGSNGEGLSRYLAEYEMAPNAPDPWMTTGTSWAAAGFPDWISTTNPTDRDYPSTGAATVYIGWMLSKGYSIDQITQAGGSTLAANYTALTAGSNAYGALVSDLSGITVTSDDPWAVSAQNGAQRVKADFDGDGVEDVLIVNPSGTYEYLGNRSGGFTGNAWVRNDLRLNQVSYVPGDFNGDGRTDLIIVDPGGSFEYLGNAGGGFTASPWVRTDLPLGKVAYVPGDFNGDGATDLVIVTAGGSYEYTGLPGGGFTANVWQDASLALHRVEYVTGDFNGDGAADLLVVNGSGTSEIEGRRAGGFTGSVWTRPDLTSGIASYTTGDFNGDRLTDLVITTPGGSYEYTGLSYGGFTGNVWTRPDLPLGRVRYVPGDFNGDGIDDLMIETDGGSYEYTGLASGGFTGGVWQRSYLPISVAEYTAGDFNGDGKTDLLIVDAGGTFEYTGLAAGGFTPNVWVRNDLGIRISSYL